MNDEIISSAFVDEMRKIAAQSFTPSERFYYKPDPFEVWRARRKNTAPKVPAKKTTDSPFPTTSKGWLGLVSEKGLQKKK